VIAGVLGLVVTYALGWFPAALVTRSALWATITAPLATGVLGALFVPLMIFLGAPFALVAIAVLLVAIGCAVWVLRRRETYLPAPPDGWPWAFAIPAAAIIPLLTFRLPPVAWDARSIWWFHARFFLEGGGSTVDALRNGAFEFSHPDYPPLSSAATALDWWFSGSQPLRGAQLQTTVLTVSAVIALGAVVWRLAGSRLSAAGAGLGALVVLGAYGVAGVSGGALAVGTSGYVDLLWAAALAAAAIALLVAPTDDADAVRIGALCLAVAASTKQEGLAAAAAVGVLALLRIVVTRRFRWPTLAWIGAAFVPVVLWLGVVVGYDVPTESRRLSELFGFESAVTDRFDPTWDAIWDRMWPLLIAALVITVAGIVLFRGDAKPRGRSAGGLLWAVWGATTVALFVAYLVSPLEIGFHLVTSVERTIIGPELVLVAIVAAWTVLGLAAFTERSDAASAASSPVLEPSSVSEPDSRSNA